MPLPDLTIRVDANCAYSPHELRQAAPVLRNCGAYWPEEPFPAHDHRSYAEAKAMLGGAVPLAAGENHYGRFEFQLGSAESQLASTQPAEPAPMITQS